MPALPAWLLPWALLDRAGGARPRRAGRGGWAGATGPGSLAAGRAGGGARRAVGDRHDGAGLVAGTGRRARRERGLRPGRAPTSRRGCGIRARRDRLETIIERTGDVGDVRLLRSVPLLDQAALDAVRQWKYEPRPHRMQVTTTVNFTLAADAQPR